jgi:glycerol-3-phosphate O-acyltransferase/dihydroxyacetone phosphate acyltransferase
MLYRALRAAADIGLHWYYTDVVVQGAERIPAEGPLVIVSNHPNALVDALLVTTTLRRRVRLTAKATLFEHPLLAPLLRAVGVVPLRRAKDELVARREGASSVARNMESFRQVTEALEQGGAVLVFPEGISHDEPALAPLKTGAARMALTASAAGARGIRVLPLGLIFERKERPRSRVLVRVGEPIDVDAWRADARADDAECLTADIDAALRHVTLNFASEERARRAVALARVLAAITEAPPTLGRTRALSTETELARRIEVATAALESASPAVARQADAFIALVDGLEARLAARGAALADVRISPRLRHGAWFVVRESLVVAAALPIALLGRAMHWLPLHAARALAMRPLARDPSRDQPAMRTIVLGLAFVPLWYALQAALVAHWLGVVPALLWLVVLFVSARVDFRLRDRLGRGWRRARTYLALRADPTWRARSLAEMQTLIADASALEAALVVPLLGER